MRLFFFSFILICSCAKETTCGAFDFSRIPFNKEYYLKGFKYTNESDTIETLLRGSHYTKTTILNHALPGCEPYFDFHLYDEDRKLDILYMFYYFPLEEGSNKTILDLSICASELEIDIDTIKNQLEEELIFNNFHHLNEKNKERMIKKIKFKNMRITEIETCAGTKWRLL